MADAGLEGDVHERAWVNFGHNRQEALELAVAAGRGDWLLFIDADEELGVSNPEFYKTMTPGVTYETEKHHDHLRYALPNLLDISQNKSKWVGAVHEYIHHLEGENRRELRKDVWIIFHSGEGARSQGVSSEEKFLRDVRVLQKELQINPEDSRGQFYLAQSYLHAGHDSKALRAYRKRTRMEGFLEEAFISQLEIGRISIRQGKDEGIVLNELLTAFEMRPARAEPLHELARYYRERDKFARACVFARAGASMPRPGDILFVSDELYQWRMLDELSVSAYWIGNYQESKACCEEILQRVEKGLDLNRDDINRVNQNIAFSNTKLEAE
jgi:tetratricopeptide (TPR) repeat protein